MVGINLVDDCIFKGKVFHKRLLPFEHKFEYNISFFWVNIKQFEETLFFKHNKFSLFSFFDRDHGDIDRNKNVSLFNYYLNFLNKNKIFGVKVIKVLCLPRIFNYQFNPVSVFVCFDNYKKPLAFILQVSNTFGERHAYLIKVQSSTYLIKKRFHVSPFFNVKGEYEVTFEITRKIVRLFINYNKDKKRLFCAHFCGDYLNITNSNLLRIFFSQFLQNFKVTIGIHYEALKLWKKGAIYYNKPTKPKEFLTKIK